ncbi:terminase large subunit [Klebsiella sp. RHBSTW-00484]|uniref:terminase large subunit n=1 Tax=unclassified Klebsiella TaxID=2608929 RepID=UPI0015E4E390|nr:MULTISPECIES: terminase TerL endonuclease subunit [unclassified Klebsiella]QLO37318.1 terminase large subunit [Klebsiella sp. RHBSTW-00484]QLT76836.1 terminase large subunit [Klebsiella sp. RHBSTW-00464]
MATYPNVNAANQYARDIVGGKILACQLTILACQRHLDDLDRAKDPNWPYRFDKNKAERFLRFSQKMPHTAGEWARRKLRIDFEPWQKFSLGVPFGWIHKKSGLRRFNEIYIEVPRKNGKSALAAAVGNYMFCADGEHGAEVYCGATTEKQAWKVFAPALLMVKKLPALRQKFSIKPWAKKMTRPDGSIFAPVIGDPGDGDSPSCAIIDEYHEHITDALYTTMTTGMGAREQPITLIITTAGYDITSPCYEKREQVVEILRKTRKGEENEGIFGIIYGLDEDDDWTKPESLIKANPNYGISVKENFLRAKQLLAISNPSQTNKILTKHFNRWVSAKTVFYDLQKWMAAADKSLKLSDFADEECWLGIDLASKVDLNAVIPVFRRDIEGITHFYCVGSMFWVPEDTIYSVDPKLKHTSERYQSFVGQGVLIPTDGAEVDYRLIFESILQLRQNVKIAQCPIDPYGATSLRHLLEEEGLEPVEIRQNFTHMSDPMREIEAALASGRFHHDGNPIMNWCIQNVVGRYLPGSDDIVRPTKEGKQNKIDGAVGLMMGIGRAMLNSAVIKSVYDEEDIVC